MKITGMYIKEHRRRLFVYAGAVLIFAGVAYLYELNMEAVEYAFLLAGVWLLGWGVYDFARYVKGRQKRRDIASQMNYFCPDPAAAETMEEQDYLHMLEELWREKKEQESQAEETRQESLDYYRLWAHQIKTPISAMRLLIQEEEGEEGAENTEYLRRMKRELFQVEQYVEMVLSYLRIEDISKDLVLQWYPAEELVKQAVRKYSRLFILQKLSLHMEDMDYMVLTDEKWFVFVLEQILSNALKYTKEGGISIYLARKDKEDETELVIADTGIGIYAEDLPRVFERGFTGYNGRENKKSTGIGLYLCKTVLDKLGHKIYITSAPGEGTQVHIRLGRKPLMQEDG